MNPITSPLRRALTAATLGLALAAAARPALAQVPGTGDAFAEAMQSYEQSHWEQAHTTLARLADQGHHEAARIVLQMWAYGPRLYGVEFVGSADRLARWTQVLGCTPQALTRDCVLTARR